MALWDLRQATRILSGWSGELVTPFVDRQAPNRYNPARAMQRPDHTEAAMIKRAALLPPFLISPAFAAWVGADGQPVINPNSGRVLNPYVWYDARTGLINVNALGPNGVVDSHDNLTLIGDDVGLISLIVGYVDSGVTATQVLPVFADGIAWGAPAVFGRKVQLSGNAITASFLPIGAGPVVQLPVGLGYADFGLDEDGNPLWPGEFYLAMGVNFSLGQPGSTLYSDQPIAIVGPVFTTDLNGDGLSDCADIDGLSLAIVNGDSNPMYDVDVDGDVDMDDLEFWRQLAGIPAGDANLDGTVDVTDFNIWNATKFVDNQFGWCLGDFTTNGRVDVADFNVWNSHKFTSGAVVTPEPAVASWLWLPLLAWMRSHRSG